MSVLGWMELPEDDTPGEDIWLDTEAISKHFSDVKERYRAQREQRAGGWEEVEERPLFEIDDEAKKVRARAGAGK
jgi:hypothetical protein